METHKIPTHIALEGVCNARHLGGYATSRGYTRNFALIRCEAPTQMTDRDIAILLKLGVRTVIDLRNRSEILASPNPFSSVPTVALHHVPIFPNDKALHSFDNTPRGESNRWILDNCQTTYRDALELILQATGGVLFHCAAGRDRTGILSMLLLLLAGVAEPVVVEEYCHTQTLLAPWVEREKQKTPDLSREELLQLHGACPEFILAAIEHLNSRYGGAEEYIKGMGFCKQEIQSLRDLLVHQTFRGSLSA